MDVSFTHMVKLKKETEVAAQPGRDNISVFTCTGFCLRETGRNACPCRSAQQFCTFSCHRAQGTASLWMNIRCVAGRLFRKWRGIKVYLFLPCGKIFAQLQTCTLFHKLSVFYCREDNIPSSEAHKQLGAEPAQYGLEINFNSTVTYSLPHLNDFWTYYACPTKYDLMWTLSYQYGGKAENIQK